MKVHELKTWQKFFDLVWRGDKPFEVRKNDRDFRSGDQLRLREYTELDDIYTGREIIVTVTSIISGCPGILPDYVVIGFDPNTIVRATIVNQQEHHETSQGCL